MKIVDLTPLKNNDTEYERLAASVSEHYKCEWDDVVHDSYGVYVKQVGERSRSIREIRCKAEVLAKEAEDLKIDELIRKTEILCREADSV
jgi:hypothetical protein